MKILVVCSILVLNTFLAYGQADEPVPIVNFTEVTINTTFPQYRSLTMDGGMIEIEGGVRGLILYREDADNYFAYERNCSYNPNSACARIDIDLSRIFFICRCCGANFNLSDGYPSKGPATWPLRRYKVLVSGNILTVTDEIVN